MIRRKTFPVLVSVRGPRRSVDRLAKGYVAGNSLSIAVRRHGAVLIPAHDAQLATQSCKSAVMESQ